MNSARVAVIGHVDHGKSTLIGRLLYDSARISDDRVAEIDAMVDALRSRFEFAYFLDSLEEEVAQARTIDTVSVRLQGARDYTIVDVPGHACFVRNMLTGAASADAAVLVVSVVEGVEEQTRRHLWLARMVGVRRMVVAINKMDAAGWQEAAFRAREAEVLGLLGGGGAGTVPVVPVSATTGANVVRASAESPWYAGPTVLEALDAADLARPAGPTRVVVQGGFDHDGGTVWFARVASGQVAVGDVLAFEPSGVVAAVTGLHEWGRAPVAAAEGDAIAFSCAGVLSRGDVGGPVASPPRACRAFRAEAVVVEGTLGAGDGFELRCGTSAVACTIEAVEAVFSSETGEPLPGAPAVVRELEAAVLRVVTPPVVVEPFAASPSLGRFVLGRAGRAVAAGVVLGT